MIMMNTKESTWQKYTLIYLVVIVLIVILVSFPRFGYEYPDSRYYFDVVSFFQGSLSGNNLTAPFCYRPLLPLISSIFPFESRYVFAAINLCFMIFISWMLFFIAKNFGSSDFISFLTASLFSVSLVVLFYGAVALVDPGAIFFLSVVYYLMIKNNNGIQIALFLTIGVLFKEVALVGVFAFLLYNKLRGWQWTIFPIATYALLRFVMPSGNPGFIWMFHLGNFVDVGSATLRTFLLGLGPYILFLLFGIFFFKSETNVNLNRWLLSLGVPSLCYIFIGLFFAHFDVRFIWPVYFAMLPFISNGIEFILDKLMRFIPDRLK